MKITMLGTAAIGYPLTFCNCDNCKEARIHGGKSLRKRASVLINDDLIIDIGPDTQSAMMMYNKDMSKVKYLIQTHIHTDHYDAGLLTSRIPYMAMQNHEWLEIIAHPTCLDIMSERVSNFEKADLISEEGQKKLKVHSNKMLDGEKIALGKYTIKSIHTEHDKKHGSLLYVVCDNNKCVFYATDTPALTDTAIEQLKEFKLDCIIMDHTFGNVDYSFSHLNESLFIEQINKLKELNIVTDKTIVFGTHISHDGMPYHELAEERAKSNGYHIAYDGMELEI
jgi:phosphoribosyl 1,2-cyclic phosphate phosphodiesterase